MAKRARKAAPAKRAYHHGDLRRALLLKAEELIEKEDVAELTLREVARQAGVTHSAPYHHFATKTDLLAAIAENGFRSLYTEQLQALGKAGPDPVKRFASLGTAYVKFAVARPGRFRVMFRANQQGWSEYAHVLEAAQESFVLLTSTADEAIRAGHVEADLLEFVLAAWSVVHGLATLWVDGPLKRVTALTGDRGIEEIAARITALSTSRLMPR